MKKIHLSKTFSHVVLDFWQSNVPFHENSCKCFAIRNQASSMETNDGVSELGHDLDAAVDGKRSAYICIQSEARCEADREICK